MEEIIKRLSRFEMQMREYVGPPELAPGPSADDLDEIIITLSRLQEATPEGWQPIETAPKDGTRIDVWVRGSRTMDVFWSDIEEWWSVTDRFDEGDHCPLAIVPKPTHWMPLPAPPRLSKAGA